MSDRRQEFLRASARIRERLLAPGSSTISVCLPDYYWHDCAQTTQLLERVSGRGWQAATGQVQRRLASELRALQGSLQEVLREIESPSTLYVASQREIFQDLLAIEEEFGNLEIDLKEKELSVTTEAIELEKVYLGPFQIILKWTALGDPTPYRVVATDPEHGSASRCDTPHPHVDGCTLCEGEAKLPIRQALKQGRLFDFFTIVRQTLKTYNAASAYVKLCDWQGVTCNDCGILTDEDDQYSCEQCGAHVCDGCRCRCPDCECDHCSHCTQDCPGCDEQYCKTCLFPCRNCDTHFCKECLTDGQCDDCRAADDDEDNDDRRSENETEQPANSPKTSPATRAAADPHRVRQAVVPARRRRH